jgi:hypothetical protein
MSLLIAALASPKSPSPTHAHRLHPAHDTNRAISISLTAWRMSGLRRDPVRWSRRLTLSASRWLRWHWCGVMIARIGWQAMEGRSRGHWVRGCGLMVIVELDCAHEHIMVSPPYIRGF